MGGAITVEREGVGEEKEGEWYSPHVRSRPTFQLPLRLLLQSPPGGDELVDIVIIADAILLWLSVMLSLNGCYHRVTLYHITCTNVRMLRVW